MSLALLAAAACGAVAAEGGRRFVTGYKAAKTKRRVEELTAEALERTRPVSVADVMQFRLPAHAKCRGRGLLYEQRNGKSHPIPCRCAEKRFLERNADKLCKVAGEYRWKPAEAK